MTPSRSSSATSCSSRGASSTIRKSSPLFPRPSAPPPSGSSSLLSTALSVDLFVPRPDEQSDDETIVVRDLEKPIRLQLPVRVERARNARCAYWNDTRARWQLDGVELHVSNDQLVGDTTVKCETTHLTTFAVVAAVVLAAFAGLSNRYPKTDTKTVERLMIHERVVTCDM